ncbi:hypothetical protein GCM10027515_31900 [Schumannella luteola]|uniref:Uncharacterized protein n=1 Tax=Schumannella luteola TaxID=472059 RepID=A0A852YMP4_9MICO|nr:hypothetical protein [Schumannella luteola]NYG99009.1 hypothetical protein [Schumannella luteola]TPX06369.1 hypothetical protein FJ656_01680 [Schumannella luteola]
MTRFRTSNRFEGDRYSVDFIDTTGIEAVDKAATEHRAIDARYKEAKRARDAALKDVAGAKDRLVAQAAEYGLKKGELPKDIRKGVKTAKEAAEEGQLRVDALAEMVRTSWTRLVAHIEANEDALATAAREKGEQSLQRMAAAREAFSSAAREAELSYGLLGMFYRGRIDGLQPILAELPKSQRKISTDEALTQMGKAVGFANLDLEVARRGTGPTRDEVEEISDGEA